MSREITPNFIVFEGIDGSGTTTQLKLLGEYLERHSIPFRLDSEPTKGPIGRLIRKILTGEEPSVSQETLSWLFAADRNEHINGDDGVLEVCKRDQILVSDRYFFSSLVYQGISCGFDLPKELNRSFPIPEIVFFFDLPAEISMKRIQNRDFLDIFENLDFQKKVSVAYHMIFEEFQQTGVNIVYLDASQPVGNISGLIQNAIDPILMRYRVQ